MLTEGQILEGKYKVGRLLGKGGMGAVFQGEHTRINRTVAIKVLHDVDPDSENAQRFEKEAQAAGRIGSDHIVEVLDLGLTPEGERFMVMEYLDGESLKTRLSRGLMKPADLIPLCVQILDGLAAAHAASIVHRDLKPDNIFIVKEKAGRRDFVKIVDFGISKFASVGAEGAMTKTGTVLGTPYYMSPEQARAANEVDNRSDLYSVGVIMYQAVSATVPFHGTTFTELLFKIVFENAPDVAAVVPDLDRGFAALIMKAMARDPNDRFPTAAAFREALTSWREGSMPAAAPASNKGTLIFAPPTASTVAAAPSTASRASNPFPFVSTPPSMPAQNPAAVWAQTPSGMTPAGTVAGVPPQAQFSQSVSAGSQTLDSVARSAPPRRLGLVAGLALAVISGGGAAAFFATRHSSEPSGKPEPTSAVAAATPTAEARSASTAPPAIAPTIAPVANASATPESPSTSATASTTAAAPTATPIQVAQGQWTPPSKPTPAQPQPPPAQPPPVQPPPPAVPPPTPPGGKLKDLGY